MLAAMELAVTAVRDDEIDPLVEVTAQAFVDEQLLRWPLGDHPDPLTVMEAEFRGLHSAAARLGSRPLQPSRVPTPSSLRQLPRRQAACSSPITPPPSKPTSSSARW